jgi:hypothetical protein
MAEEERPTGITYKDAIEAAEAIPHGGSVDFEGREVRLDGFNAK